jgi:hypothetical protein
MESVILDGRAQLQVVGIESENHKYELTKAC